MAKLVLTEYFIDNNVFDEMEKQLKKYRNILIIHGDKGLKSIENDIRRILSDKNTSYIHFGGECSFRSAEILLTKLYNDSLSENFENYDLVLAVGGGKCIDTAKIIAHQLKLPIFTVPTIPATCSAVSALSVVYTPEHKFQKFYFLPSPPDKTFINLDVILAAPKSYLWAGIGDTLAKYYEFHMKAGNEYLNISTALGRESVNLCKNVILKHGKSALETEVITDEFKDLISVIIVVTGVVSNLIDEKYNGALAHDIFHSLTLIPEIEKNHLHGEVVATCILMQLKLENKEEQYQELYNFYKEVKLPTSFNEILNKDYFANFEEEVFNKIIETAKTDGIELELTHEKLKEVFYL